MGIINILDTQTANMIAAGEVVDRPASALKELIENSIDAESKFIVIEIKNGGKSYIRVTDDGTGIDKDDIDYAFFRYSTSKIRSVEDLNHIYSLGFRGEALASISTIGKVEALTKTRDNNMGIQVLVENGKIKEKNIIGCQDGTTMIVKDIFYNLPVRQKFLKDENVESNYIGNIVNKLSLGNPNISFKYIRDNKMTLKTPGNGDLSSCIYSVLGKEILKGLIEVKSTYDSIKVYGLISNNNVYRGNRSHQYIYINGRYIKSYFLSGIIQECYRSLIPINKYPVFILFIEMDPQLIDINVHPTKQEIKFKNEKAVKDVVQGIIRDSLKSGLKIHDINFTESKKDEKSKENIDYIDIVTENRDDKHYNDNVYDYYNEKIEEQQKNGYNNYNEREIVVIDERENNTQKPHEEYNFIDNNTVQIKNIFKNCRKVGILFSTYILLEDRINDYVYLIDQHAAHERIMYEKYKKEYENENVAVQMLISPEVLDLTNDELNLAKDNKELFNKLGFEIEDFGYSSILIRGVPLIFGKPNNKELIYLIIDSLNNNIKSNYEVKIEKIMKIACTSAIKGGDKIHDMEIDSLINELGKAENPFTCPHGRPVFIKMSRKDLEKEFKRII